MSFVPDVLFVPERRCAAAETQRAIDVWQALRLFGDDVFDMSAPVVATLAE